MNASMNARMRECDNANMQEGEKVRRREGDNARLREGETAKRREGENARCEHGEIQLRETTGEPGLRSTDLQWRQFFK